MATPVTRGERRARLVLALLIIVFVALALPRGWYNDDAFITFRYAKHLAAGHGFVWNAVDGEPIEGSSSLAWSLLNALGIAAGLDPVPFSQGLGAIAGAFGLAVLYSAGRRRLGLPPGWALVAPALLAAHRQWVLWSVSGLETVAAIVLMLAATLMMVREQSRERPGWWASGVLFFIATLFRPEAPLMHLAAGVGCAGVRRNVSHWRAVVLSGLTHGVLLAGLIGWRLAYFGYPLPNTFYAKVGGLQLGRGLAYMVEFVMQTHGWLWLPVLLVGVVLTIRRGAPILVGALVAQIVIWCAWIAIEGGGAWEFRFMATLLPALALLIGLAVHLLRGKLTRRWRLLAALALTGALVFSQASTVFTPFRPFGRLFTEMESEDVAELLVVSAEHLKATADDRLREGRALAPYLTPQDRLATGWAGALPYVTDVWHFDPWGLNDPEIARREFDTESVLFHQRHAEWSDMQARRVMLVDIYNRFLFERPYPPHAIRMMVMPWIEAGVMVYCVELPQGTFRYWIFTSARPRDEVEAWLAKHGLPLRYVVPLV
ncbi:MAG: hypothetical protein JSV80_04340 [Acidobacteriota bacterium]|nr:MAG: hypothetical protein JSV80_04340 [Acidobacteriota bacterium]